MTARPAHGNAPSFPYLDERESCLFPPPDFAPGGIIAYGGNLSPGVVLSAYEQGLFPWYGEDSPILWHSPDPRFILLPQDLHISRSMQKELRKGRYEIRYNHNFAAVIAECAKPRKEDGTWLTPEMIEAYNTLHQLGYALSAESWIDGTLAGGCYGIKLGSVFFGESMFTRAANASKAAFLTLAQKLFAEGIQFIDSQVYTPHLASMGAKEVSRTEFLRRLRGVPHTRGAPLKTSEDHAPKTVH